MLAIINAEVTLEWCVSSKPEEQMLGWKEAKDSGRLAGSYQKGANAADMRAITKQITWEYLLQVVSSLIMLLSMSLSTARAANTIVCV